MLDAIERFRFGDAELAGLRAGKVVDETTLDFLAGYRFDGDIRGYAEGEAWFPGSPVLVVESDFAHGVLLETVILSVLNHDSAIASAASRMTGAAGTRPCIEMGSRRTHEEAAVAAARAAYMWFRETSTSRRATWGVPTPGGRPLTRSRCCTTTTGGLRRSWAWASALRGSSTPRRRARRERRRGRRTGLGAVGSTCALLARPEWRDTRLSRRDFPRIVVTRT